MDVEKKNNQERRIFPKLKIITNRATDPKIAGIDEELDAVKHIVNSHCIKFQKEMESKLDKLSSWKIFIEAPEFIPFLRSHPGVQLDYKKSLVPSFGIFEYSKECISLIKDLKKGRLNSLLTEMLNNAETSIVMKKRDPHDLQSRDVLSLKVEVAATFIDKYANLLKFILKQGSNDKPGKDNDLILQSKKFISDSAERLKSLSLSLALLKLRTNVAKYINAHSLSCDFFSEFCFASSKKKFEQSLTWLENLVDQGLTANETAGAIYYMRKNLTEIHQKKRRDALRDELDLILSTHDYPMYLKEQNEEIAPYLAMFKNKLELLKLNGPFSSFEELKVDLENMIGPYQVQYFSTAYGR